MNKEQYDVYCQFFGAIGIVVGIVGIMFNIIYQNLIGLFISFGIISIGIVLVLLSITTIGGDDDQ